MTENNSLSGFDICSIPKYECKKMEEVLTVKENWRGSTVYCYQCIKCGRFTRDISKKELTEEQKNKAVSFNQEAQDNYYKSFRDTFEEQKLKEKEDWFKEYNIYLNSPEWIKKRGAVLKRDQYTCQACLINKASEVHHKTYRYYKNEPLFDLVAVCRRCHDKLHELTPYKFQDLT